MKMHKSYLWGVILTSVVLSGCELSEEEKDKLESAQVDLEQLADQIIITYPANDSEVTSSTTVVRADIPAAAEAQEVTLFVDGIEVAKDSDGAPWEITWPAYYWADNSKHTLLLKTITGAGNEVRNNQAFQVTVSESARSALSFGQGLDGTVIQDDNKVTVTFSEFSGATRYDLKYTKDGSETIVPLQSRSFELTDMEVGQYDFSYRAVQSYSGLTTQTGPWSDSAQVVVKQPDLPTLNDPEVTATDDGYDLVLSWQDMGEGNTYNVEVSSVSDSVYFEEAYSDVSASSLSITGLKIGEYQWRLQRVNPFGHESEQSDVDELSVGLFNVQLGGSKDEYTQKFFASSDGGYILLATTESREIYPNISGGTHSWIIKLDSNGETEWDYVYESDSASIVDLVETSNGEIVAVGMNWGTKKSMALKLDGKGHEVWSVSYRPEHVSERYDFTHVVELDDSLIVSAREWGNRDGRNLHSISKSDGTVSDGIAIPKLDGNVRLSISHLLATTGGNIIVAGTAYPDDLGDDVYEYEYRGAYAQILDADFSELSGWDNAGKFKQSSVSGLLELPNGTYLIYGADGNDNSPALIIFDSSGKEQKNYFGGGYDYYGVPLSLGTDGNIYAYMQDGDLNYIVELSSSLHEVGESYIHKLKYDGYVKGIVAHEDGAFSIVMNESQGSPKNTDIVLMKAIVD